MPLLFKQSIQVRAPFVQIIFKDIAAPFLHLFGRFKVMGALIIVRLVADLDLRLERPVRLAHLFNRIAKLRVVSSPIIKWDRGSLTSVPIIFNFLMIFLDESIGHLHCIKDGSFGNAFRRFFIVISFVFVVEFDFPVLILLILIFITVVFVTSFCASSVFFIVARA